MTGNTAAQCVEVIYHVHLIAISQFMSHIQPGKVSCHAFGVKSHLKARDASETFGTHTNFFDKSAFVLAKTHRTAVRKLLDPNRSPASNEISRAVHDARV